MKFVILTIEQSAREINAVVPECGHLHLDRGWFYWLMITTTVVIITTAVVIITYLQ